MFNKRVWGRKAECVSTEAACSKHENGSCMCGVCQACGEISSKRLSYPLCWSWKGQDFLCIC